MIKNLDLTKIKRLIVFGCSFTNYYWPTWADILRHELPNAEYFNFARCGGGNLFIASRLSEAEQKLKFNENDLVITMWTTLCREDRYFHGNWCLPGNIFTQQIYNKDFVDKFAQPEGYLVRDLALMKLTIDASKSYQSNTIFLHAQKFDSQQEKDHRNEFVSNTKKIIKSYKSLTDTFIQGFFEKEMNQIWENGHTYQDPNHGTFQDYHPNPIRHFNYLKKIGFNLSDKTKKFAHDANEKLLKTKTKQEIIDIFNNEPNYNHETVRDICF